MNKPKTVVVLGKFDGVHIAHTKLITTAVNIASENGAKSLVYSMQKNDAEVMTRKNEKINIIKNLGVDNVVFRELDKGFMALTAEEFVDSILKEELNACCVVVGENFRFGKDRSAGAQELKLLCNKSGMEVVVIDTVHLGNETVSSTFVKKLLSEGNVSIAGQYLGRAFSLSGTVSEGKHLGRSLGFPTVNIYPDALTVVPKNGVYVTNTVYCQKKYPSITNVGVNPTVEDGKNIKVETHIFGQTDNWYGEEITVEFLDFIRPETHFDNVDELKNQVVKDKKTAKQFHNIKD